MAKKRANEKRKYVRAVISAQARVKLLDKEEFDRIRTLRAEVSPLDYPYPPKDASDSAASSEPLLRDVAAALFQLNEKMDRIIDILESNQNGGEKLKVIETVNISGSGISMILSGPLKVGQLLHISLRIPGFPLGVFQAYGEVIRITPLTGKDAGFFDVGVKFHYMSEEERERLIAYTFSQQRRVIRQSKDHGLE